MNKKNVLITIISVLILVCIFAFARTTTTDLGLVKPTWDENVDILVDINANSDILEAFANDPLEFDTGERLEDRVGAMFSGNTETFLTLTYQDADNTIDAVVPVKDEDAMTSDSATYLATQRSIKAYADTLHALQYLKTEIDTLSEVEAIYSKNIIDTTELNTFSKLQALVADKTLVNEEDIFTIDANWVNTAHPWADNEVADNITIDLATLATTFTCTDNESEALACPLVFVDGATGAQGAETDGDLTYNPSTGTLTATIFAGALSGNATTCTTASAGDAAVDFFGAGVDAVTDTTECTDLEGTLLSITTGTLNVTIPADHITYDMMQDTSDTDKILGRSTAGAGTIEEIACTSAGRDILDDADASTQRTTLGLVIGTNVLAEKTIGIADNNLLEVDDADAADNDYAKFTAVGLEGRSYTEVISDLSVVTQTSASRTIYCNNSTGNDSTGDGTSGTPYATIQKCIDETPTIIAHDVIIAVGADETISSSIDFSGHHNIKSLTVKAMDTSDNDLYDEGTADAGAGNNELDDTAKAWTVDFWNGGYVFIYQGTGAGQIRSISDTTATKLTVTVNWTTNPDATSDYVIVMVTITGDGVADGFSKLIDNTNIYGFRWATFTNYAIKTMGGSIRSNLSINYNLFVNGANCVSVSYVSNAELYYNYYEIPAGGFGLVMGSCDIVLPRKSVFHATTSGQGTGLLVRYYTFAQMYITTNINTFIDLALGAEAIVFSSLYKANSQVYTNCTADFSPVGTTDPSYVIN